MIPESITFTESVELGRNGEILNRWPKASIKITLEKPTEVNEATEYAMKYVQETLKKAADLSKKYFSNGVHKDGMQPPEPEVLPIIQVEKTTKGFNGYKEQINSSATIEELKTHHTIASLNPKLMDVYNNKMEELSKTFVT